MRGLLPAHLMSITKKKTENTHWSSILNIFITYEIFFCDKLNRINPAIDYLQMLFLRVLDTLLGLVHPDSNRLD